jgi:hypothetical protein
MPTDRIAKKLHDKATRGLVLSTEERAQLEAWYAEQDQEDSVVLGAAVSPQQLATLHSHIDTALAQLQTVTQRLQALTAHNAAVRQEIAVLQRQLAQVSTHEPA